MEAYEDMIRNTATEKSPWYVVPTDNKWFTRVVVAAVVETLASLDLKYPEVGTRQTQGTGSDQGSIVEKIAREVWSQEKFSLNTADKNNGNLQEQTQEKKEVYIGSRTRSFARLTSRSALWATSAAR